MYCVSGGNGIYGLLGLHCVKMVMVTVMMVLVVVVLVTVLVVISRIMICVGVGDGEIPTQDLAN